MGENLKSKRVPLLIAAILFGGTALILGKVADWELVSILVVLSVLGILIAADKLSHRNAKRAGAGAVIHDGSMVGLGAAGNDSGDKDSNWFSDFFGGGGDGGGGGFDVGGGGGDGGG